MCMTSCAENDMPVFNSDDPVDPKEQFHISVFFTGSVTVNLRLDSNKGPVVVTVTIGKTGNVEKYRVFSGKVKNVAGVHDLYICFDKASGDVRLDYWQFK